MGAWKEIVDYTVPSNTTSVDFTGLNITKDDFIKINTTIVNNDSSNRDLQLLINDSLNSKYQFIFANGTNILANRPSDDLSNRFSRISANGTGSSFSHLRISENGIANTWTNTTFRNNEDLFIYKIGQNYTQTVSTINKLTFQLDASNALGAGSRIQIYKLTAKKVADVVVTADSSQIDITGLDIKKGDEYLLVSEFKRTNSFTLYLGANGDTNANNYRYQRIRAGASSDGSDTSASRANVPAFIQTGSTGSTEFNGLSYTHIKLSNIGAFTFQSYGISDVGGVGGDNRIPLYSWFVSSVSENITNINQLNIFRGTNDIGAGSRFQLYKLYEGGN